jgi:hypothetical protein
MATTTVANFATVASLATPQTLLAADATRQAVIITNTDAAILYILIAGTGTVSSTNMTVAIAAAGNYTVPSVLASERITGIWASDGSGSALITYK